MRSSTRADLSGQPNVRLIDEVLRQKPMARSVRAAQPARKPAVPRRSRLGTQEEIRRRAAMMASVDEAWARFSDARGEKILDDTVILFLGDNGFFFGEHGLGAERRFAYEEGIRTAFFMRYPRLAKPGSVIERMVALDIAPTMIELGGGRPGAHIQGRSLVPLPPRRRLANFSSSSTTTNRPGRGSSA